MAEPSPPSPHVVVCPFCGYPYPMTTLQREVYAGRNMGCQNCGRPFRVEPLPPPAAEPTPPVADGEAPSPATGDAPAQPTRAASPATPPAAPGVPPPTPAPAAPPAPRRNAPAAAGFACAIAFLALIAAAVVCSAASDSDAGAPVGGRGSHTPAGVLTALALASGVLGVLLSSAGLVRTRHAAGPWGRVRTAGRARAVAGLALAGGGLLIAAFVLSTVRPLADRQHEMARREVCEAHFQAIAGALASYADQNNGRFPDSLDVLVGSGALSADDVVCPSTTDTPAPAGTAPSQPGHTSYRYAGKGLTRAAPDDAVLVWEPVANHGDVAHVLFRDGRIQPVTASIAGQLAGELKAGQNPGQTATLIQQNQP